MTMFNKVGANYALSNGIGNAQIKQAINTFGQSLAKQWDSLTEIASAVLIQYVSQEQVKVHHNKGDTSLVSQLADVLSDNNHSMYIAFNKSCESIAGLKVSLVQVDDTTVEPAVDVTKKARQEVLASFDEALGKMIDKGIKESFAKKRKATGTGSSSAKTPAQQAGEVSSVSIATKVAQDTGIQAVLESVNDDGKAAHLAEVQVYIQAILEHAINNPDRNGVKQLLESTVNKLNKGFTLGAAMKAAA